MAEELTNARLISTAPDYYAFTQAFLDELAQYFEEDEDLNGGDAVQWLQDRYFEAKALQTRAGRSMNTCP